MIFVELSYTPHLTRQERIMLSLPNKMRNLRPFMKNMIAPAMNDMLARHWATKGGAFGHKWAPWEPATRAKRIRKGTAGKGILIDEEHLFKSIFRERSADNRLRVIDGGLELRFNTRIPYAVFHQVGTRFMADRQVFPDPIPESFKKTARGLFREYLLGDPEDA